MGNSEPKKKPGRPRVTDRKPSEGQPILSARVGRDMYTAAVELAAADGISLAEWVRNALIGRILQGKAAQQGLMLPLIDRKFH